MSPIVFDKCCGCISLKTGCFILGYLNLIGSLIGTVLPILTLAGVAEVMQNNAVYTVERFVVVITSILLIFMLVALVFAIVLLVGLHKNKPDHLKAYLIYSVILHLIFTVGSVIYCSINPFVTIGTVVQDTFIILLGIYFLLVIRSQYYEMKNPSQGPAYSEYTERNFEQISC